MTKRKVLLLTIMCILAFAGCNKMNTYETESSMPAGSTEEFVYSEAEICLTGNKIIISPGAELGSTEVVLQPVDEMAESGAMIPMIMVNGELYLDTGLESSVEARCGVMDGTIDSAVSGTEKPVKDNQSNFGTDLGYQYGPQEGTIEIFMNESWRIFAKEEVRQQILFPSELYELCGYPTAEDMMAEEIWGITLTAENVTPTSVTIKCTQSGGEPTGELQTGSWYIVENWTQENGWKEMPYIIQGNIGWTAEAWIIPPDNKAEWKVNWEWLYGELPAGKYRIGKEIMDFRATGDYDKAIYFAEFNIE